MNSNGRISCVVEKSLPNILFVSFESKENKIYQGALIHHDTNFKGCLGVENFGLKLKEDNPRDYNNESFYSTLERRHTYYYNNPSPLQSVNIATPFTTAKTSAMPSGSSAIAAKKKKLGVRLRARQVLCNNCKHVCNEKGENVQQQSSRNNNNNSNNNNSRTSTRKAQEAPPPSSSTRRTRRQQNDSSIQDMKLARKFSLVPKLRRLNPSEIEKFSEKSQPQQKQQQQQQQQQQQPLIRIKLSSPCLIKSSKSENGGSSGSSSSNNNSSSVNKHCQNVGRRALRKKRSAVGSMEDLWDETIFVESSSMKNKNKSLKLAKDENSGDDSAKVSSSNDVVMKAPDKIPSTPVIKISFGSQHGKGTVLKIPPKARNDPEENYENDENFEKRLEETSSSSSSSSSSAGAKAARKALKRARKEAQRRLNSSRLSPHYHRGSPASAYRSPGRMGMSPARAFVSGNFSPARSPFMSMSPSGFNSPVRSITPGSSPAYSVILPTPAASPGGRPRNKMIIRRPKHKRKKHKRNKKDDEDNNNEDEMENRSSQYNEPSSSENREPSSINEELSGQTVDSCMMEDGKTMCVGDIVWGKQDDNPWWPGKVTDIYLKPDVSGEIQPEAKIAWYALSNGDSSPLLCAQIKPFKEFFQDCFSKTQDSSSYREAIDAASEDLGLQLSASSTTSPVNCQI